MDGGAKTIRAIAKPDNTWVCDDDSGGDLQPRIDFQRVRTGVYKIWVGVYRAGLIADYTLQVTSQR